ncbi:fumarylacetoacetate hydrolase family protein [Xanthobacter sp.]|uniref:fumarylacetoacetate hydrolase family protein n=1 Tax=Xanthobacter sp. TaxID=35809 RepID=UPI0035AF00A5
MRLDVNGLHMKSGNTLTKMFGVPEIVACCSRYLPLKTGDIVATGTPPGLAWA